MSLNDMKNAIDIINGKIDEADFDGPKDDALIKSAEKVLDLSFPTTYRYFLENLGAGDIAGQEFYGLITSDFFNSSIPDAVWITMQERNNSNLPSNYIIISSTGDGDYVVLDCAQPGIEAPVELWSPGVNDNHLAFKPLANDFGEFFYKQIQSIV
ncbi:SMI1/KNR4 family protein [Yersinia sp. HM-2024]|uniref:SMI1/KNR4 family protein n=1 Tax=Yersinia sp. HM-2024 TaxID=3344550 RepID=UPI00370D4CBE